jgi:hypothetical protein
MLSGTVQDCSVGRGLPRFPAFDVATRGYKRLAVSRFPLAS